MPVAVSIAPSAAPPVGLLRLTVKVSSSSKTPSSLRATAKVCTVSPWLKVRVPLAGVKSFASAVSPPPMEVAKSTVWVNWASTLRLTVKIMLPPPSDSVSGAMVNCGVPSSSLMVPVAVGVPMVPPGAPTTLLMVTRMVSVPSNSASPVVTTVIVCELSRAPKFRVPELTV